MQGLFLGQHRILTPVEATGLFSNVTSCYDLSELLRLPGYPFQLGAAAAERSFLSKNKEKTPTKHFAKLERCYSSLAEAPKSNIWDKLTHLTCWKRSD